MGPAIAMRLTEGQVVAVKDARWSRSSIPCVTCGSLPSGSFPGLPPDLGRFYSCSHPPVVADKGTAPSPADTGHVHGYARDDAGAWRCVSDYFTGPGCGERWPS